MPTNTCIAKTVITFMSSSSHLQLRVVKLSLAGRGSWWSKLTCKRGTPYSDLTVHMRLAPVDPLAPVDVRFRWAPWQEG